VVHFRDEFLSFLCCGTSWFKNNFHHSVKQNVFNFSTNIPAFFGNIAEMSTDQDWIGLRFFLIGGSGLDRTAFFLIGGSGLDRI